MDRLLGEVIRYFEYWLEKRGAGANHLPKHLEQLSSLKAKQVVQPKNRAIVETWFPQTVQIPTSTYCQPLVAELANTNDQLYWTTVPEDYLGKSFADQFAFTQLVGPWEIEGEPAAYKSETIAVGFSLQAPNLFYAPHYHKAQEFYGVLSGTARWQLGHTGPAHFPPGSFIFHDVDVPHAMETADEPLLCIWAWIGDLDSPIEVPSHTWL